MRKARGIGRRGCHLFGPDHDVGNRFADHPGAPHLQHRGRAGRPDRGAERLISDSRTKSKTGIPGLRDIPVVGNLFGTTTDNVTRTELLVLITPHVVRDQKSAAEATEELRAKLPLVRSLDGR
jgi:type II/III secretion system protein